MNTQRFLNGRMGRMLSGVLGGCACGRTHEMPELTAVISGGAIRKLPGLLKELGVIRPYLVMDGHTRQAAGELAQRLLRDAGIAFDVHCLPASPIPQADMETLERLARGMNGGCDFVLGVGSGVINDLCKMLGKQTGLRTGIAASAPSIDGYVSNSSAMIIGGVKTTVYNQTPVLALCDLDILKAAPGPMLGAGIGDMAAKVISIAEWRISALVTGEYECPAIAEMMLGAYHQAVDHAGAVMRRDDEAVRGVAEGLLLSGIASSLAGVSRPASGSEHTLSHIMDMLAIRRGAAHNLHGMQVGYGVRVALAAYEALLNAPDMQKNPACVPDLIGNSRWEQDMRHVFGPQADALIRDALRDGRNAPDAIRARGASAVKNWPTIRNLMQGVLADKRALVAALNLAGVPPLRNPQALGFSPQDVLDASIHARDLRSRYIFPGLVFDLGLMPWMRDRLAEALGVANDRARYFDETGSC